VCVVCVFCVCAVCSVQCSVSVCVQCVCGVVKCGGEKETQVTARERSQREHKRWSRERGKRGVCVCERERESVCVCVLSVCVHVVFCCVMWRLVT
jgi:hypothetical protein